MITRPVVFAYLAGPIGGCSEAEAKDWRNLVRQGLLERSGGFIDGIDPLRCEPPVDGHYSVKGDPSCPKFGTSRAIASKNLIDVKRCDVTLAFLPHRTLHHQSYGTIVEIGWAHALGKPVIVVSDDPDIYDHPVIGACAGWVLDDLKSAVDVIVGIWGDYT